MPPIALPENTSNTSGFPPNFHGHVISSDVIPTQSATDNSKYTQPIPTSPSISISKDDSKITKTDTPYGSTAEPHHKNSQSPLQNRPNSTSSHLLSSHSLPNQKSAETDSHMTQRPGHVNKMAEFYVSITQSPRTPTSSVQNIKFPENTQSIVQDSSDSNISQNSPESEDDFGEMVLLDEDTDSDRDTHSSTDDKIQREHSLHSEDTNSDTLHNMGTGSEILETDDEDLLAEMGSGYQHTLSAATSYRGQHERFAEEHIMGGAFAGKSSPGHHNVYEQAEKVYCNVINIDHIFKYIK